MAQALTVSLINVVLDPNSVQQMQIVKKQVLICVNIVIITHDMYCMSVHIFSDKCIVDDRLRCYTNLGLNLNSVASKA